MTKAEAEKLNPGEIVFAVNPRCPDGGYGVDRYVVFRVNPKTIVLERRPVRHPERTSQTRADKARMETFGRSVAEALNAFVADLRQQVDAAESDWEMAKEDLAEAMEFRASSPEAS